MGALTKEQEDKMKELTKTVVKNYHAPGLDAQAKRAMLQVARTHMMPTAHYINNTMRQRYPGLFQSNVNSKPPNGATRVLMSQNAVRVHNPEGVTIGQNRRNIALAQNSVAEERTFVTMPYTWSCPIQGMQTAQYTGAISSTYLGNRTASANPVLRNSGYVPTGQLLYHSAGAGKTLLMCLTIFYWFIQWWGETPYYHRIPRNTLNTPNRTNEKGLPCLVIFISEDAQVKDMQGSSGIELFQKIMGDVQTRDSGNHRFSQKFKDVWGDFTRNLPHVKVLHNFSSTPNEQGLPVIKTDEKHDIVETWATHMVARLGKENPFYCRTTPAMGMIRSSNPGAKRTPEYTLNLDYSPFLNNFGNASTEYMNFFKSKEKGFPQLDLYLKFLTYAYAVKLQKTTNPVDAYKELQKESKVYKNFSVATGSYALFIENAIWQQYHEVSQWFSVMGSRTLGGQSNPFNLHYRSIKDMNRGHVGMLQALREGDYVRFSVRAASGLDFKKLSSPNSPSANQGGQPFAAEAAALGNHWNAWCQRNKGGVSPFFKVLQVTLERYGQTGTYFHLKLQRLMIHDALMPQGELSPIFSSDKTTVKADKESTTQTDKYSNLKKGFKIFDILRAGMKPQPSDPPETLCDTSNMRDVEQVLPGEALKVILRNTGAKLRSKDDQLLAVKAGQQLLAEKKGIGASQLWWLPYGTHDSFNGISDDQKKAYWQALAGRKLGFMKMVDYGARPVPEMPHRILIGMTSQMALHLFDKLPEHALYIVDEAQKYVGTQGKPESVKEINNIVERQNFYCMLSEAVKPRGQNENNVPSARSFTNQGNAEAAAQKAQASAQEDYTSMCKKAVQQITTGVVINAKGVPVPAGTKGASLYKFHDFPQLQNRKFELNGGGGYIQAASATPFLVKFGKNKSNENTIDKDVNELERMLRLIGSQRNLKVQQIRPSMLTGKNRSITKKNGARQQIKAAAFTKLGYRNLLQRYLTTAKLMVSFVDLSMDVTKVPLSTPRGKESTVVVSHFVPDRRARLHRADYGTGEKSEDRIGYPQMKAPNQELSGKKAAPKPKKTPATQAPMKAPTKTKKTPATQPPKKFDPRAYPRNPFS